MNKKLQINNKFKEIKFIIVLMLLLIVSWQLQASTVTQKTLTLKVKNAEIIKVLENIQNQSGYSFMYNREELSIFPKITLDEVNVTIVALLDKIFKNTGFDYNISNKNISIRKGDTKTIPELKQKMEFGKMLLKGKIIDDDKKVVIGATIIIKETGKGAISDDKGQFSIETTIGDAVEVSCMGFITQTLKISATDRNRDMVILLKENVLAVDDVVVTGIFQKSVESFTGSAVTITEKELKEFGNRNVLTTLRNIDPAFNIVENNAWGSNPNKLPEVQIRGNSSLPNVGQLKEDVRVDLNMPLVILDGFESSLQKLIDMNENEISTITLLKDASATAIYGSRGANGVIVITTKAPAFGKLRISYRGDVSFEMPDLNSYNLLNSRDKLALELQVGKFTGERFDTDLKLKKYYNYLLNEVNSGVDTHWLSKPLRVGIGQRHNIRLEGGDNSFRYSVSAQYNDIQGVMKKSSRSNFNGTITLSYVYKNLRFSNNLIVGINKSNESPYGSFGDYVRLNPYFRTYDEKGKILKRMGGTGYQERFGLNYAGLDNPLYNATLDLVNKNTTNSLNNNLSIDWTITSGLIAKVKFGIGQTNGNSDNFIPAEHTMFKDYDTDEMIMRKGRYTAGGKSNVCCPLNPK